MQMKVRKMTFVQIKKIKACGRGVRKENNKDMILQNKSKNKQLFIYYYSDL